MSSRSSFEAALLEKVRHSRLSWQDTHGSLVDLPDPDWIYRSLSEEGRQVLRALVERIGLDRLQEAGLVETRRLDLPGLPPDSYIAHRRIPRVVYPCEWTSAMLREALETFCRFNLLLHRHGFYLKDAHPVNLLFNQEGRPVFVDFGSIKQKKKRFHIRWSWHAQFKNRFFQPVFLHQLGLKALAGRLKRATIDFIHGGSPAPGWHHLLLLPMDLLFAAARVAGSERLYFQAVLRLCGRSLRQEKTRWSGYATQTQGWKYEAVREAFALASDAASVFDLAGNKGVFVFLALQQGRQGLLADIDEESLEVARSRARQEKIPLFTAHLDFCHPTPPMGVGLFHPSGYDRLRADLVLALAVSHHLAFRQRLPFRSFASILASYAGRYILAEYVDLKDFHVHKWVEKKGRKPPGGYDLQEFKSSFEAEQFDQIGEWQGEDGNRVICLFRRK